MKSVLLAAGLALTASLAVAGDTAVTYTVDQDYDDVIFGLESAITDKGLIIDAVNHVGEMLERTKEDVGSTVTIFDRAEVYNFCSAALSRKVMEADPMNLQFCPYGIFVMQKPGEEGATRIGYRIMPEGPMKEVQALLEDIVQEAISE
ncbi:DUF302 domain-containing protein [Shimia thalassica]|uniref:DUF302 domain-containing protein n=1 Tax=Shimia thalassica TaxID=1715693 RepID=UPI001C08AC84|nr:DUF302 domain-containing protein [Shimia thalassica]MBU2942488.1 DUF302 domain-containing protein [Shimia thalassica]MDO6504416.1 DUF302 domain-containing protein [Shimia thalassica]